MILRVLIAMVLFGFVASVGPTARAGELTRLNMIESTLGQTGELTLVFSDVEDVPNACDFFLRRFEYVPAMNTLLVDFDPTQPCLVDRFGKRQGIAKWKMSSSLMDSSRLVLVVNGARLGVLSIQGMRTRWTLLQK